MSAPTTAPPPLPAPAPPTRRSRRPWLLAGFAVVAALVVVVLVVFQPQRLFIDDVVDEALPGVVVLDDTAPTAAPDAAVESGDDGAGAVPPTPEPASPLEAAATQAAASGAPVAVTTGGFTSLDHPTSGTALLVVQPDGSALVRFEDLDTDNGPDLRVVVSTEDVGTGADGPFVDLGALKGNVGDQNYEVPAGVDLGAIRSVVIWCERFRAPFGEAPLVVPT